jgi:hypothetical protein
MIGIMFVAGIIGIVVEVQQSHHLKQITQAPFEFSNGPSR